MINNWYAAFIQYRAEREQSLERQLQKERAKPIGERIPFRAVNIEARINYLKNENSKI